MISTALLSDAGGDAVGVLPAAIRCVGPIPAIVLGPATTLALPPDDNLGLHELLEACTGGEVLVVDAPADGAAVLGELMAAFAVTRGVTAIVTSGRIRDAADLASLPIAIFAAGTTPRRCGKSDPGRRDVPLHFGAVVVRPGDLVACDADGVVCVPAAEIEAVLDGAERLARLESRALTAIRGGLAPRAALLAAQDPGR
jgi:RraA family protein